MFLYILTITILFYSLLLHYYKLIFFFSYHLFFTAHKFIFSLSYFLLPHIKYPIFETALSIILPTDTQKKTANKLFSQLHYFKNYPLFLINAISLFSVFFSITNRGFFASIFFYIYFTKLWLSLVE